MDNRSTRNVWLNSEECNSLSSITGIDMEMTISEYTDLYPKGYKRPTIKEALEEAGLDKGTAKGMAEKCSSFGKQAVEVRHSVKG